MDTIQTPETIGFSDLLDLELHQPNHLLWRVPNFREDMNGVIDTSLQNLYFSKVMCYL